MFIEYVNIKITLFTKVCVTNCGDCSNVDVTAGFIEGDKP